MNTTKQYYSDITMNNELIINNIVTVNCQC